LLAAACGTAWLAAAATLYFRQEKLIFQGEPRKPRSQVRHRVAGATTFACPCRGATLHGLHFRNEKPARPPCSSCTATAAMSARGQPAAITFAAPASTCSMFDYRGYGLSSAAASKARRSCMPMSARCGMRFPPSYIRARPSGRRVWPLARQRARRAAGERGASLAADPRDAVHQPRAETACRKYPFVPERLVKYPLRTDQYIGYVKCSDRAGPRHQRRAESRSTDSEALLNLATSPIELMRIDGAAHGKHPRISRL
jgi:hypothetical protein